ncbi:hypothetical protein [Streptomyces abikoensis]
MAEPLSGHGGATAQRRDGMAARRRSGATAWRRGRAVGTEKSVVLWSRYGCRRAGESLVGTPGIDGADSPDSDREKA